MLDDIDLKKKLSREEYKKVAPALQQRLHDLEKTCWDRAVPTIVVFEGWDAAGKGTAIEALTQRLDPRGFKLHQIAPPRTFEQQKPWLWRFWMRAPNRGEMALFDRSWYVRVLEERVEGWISGKEVQAAFRDIVEFERMLAEDGATMVKLFLHISKKTQKERFQAIEEDPLEAWRVSRGDWARHKKYDRYLKAAEEMLGATDAEYAPWTIVEATSKWYARKKVFATIIEAMERRLGSDAPPPSKPPSPDLLSAMESLAGEGH